jgi:FkbM family methyltransferase
MIGSGLIRSVFSESFINRIKQLLALEIDHQFEIQRISSIERFQEGKTNLITKDFHFIDSESFINQYLEIFEDQCLFFETKNQKPRIIDCGANIGISILYYKRLYPEAQIIGFEPDPKIFKILQGNLRFCNNDQVKVINKAVWNEETSIKFLPDEADGGKITEGGQLTVQTVRLSDYLSGNIDFLKMDIEGAEHDVLPSISNNLKNVKFLFLEVHLEYNNSQKLENILSILRSNGFVYSFKTVKNLTFKELLLPKNRNGFTQQLNIFAINENT